MDGERQSSHAEKAQEGLGLKVFEPLVAEGYEWINALDDRDYEVILSLDGKHRSHEWRPIKVRRVQADRRQACRESDFPWLGSHALILRRRTVDLLSDLLNINGEVLPLETDDGVELYVFNAHVVDALDERNSSIVRFPGTHRIMNIEKPAFIESAVGVAHLFRLPYRASSTYVSSRFVERVKSTGLVGLEFKKVWDSTVA